jgi:hypothetical protein
VSAPRYSTGTSLIALSVVFELTRASVTAGILANQGFINSEWAIGTVLYEYSRLSSQSSA